MSASDHAAFIRAQTAIGAPPLVPEIRLRLASEVTPLWQATEATLQATGLPPPYWAFAWPGGQALARHLLDRPQIVRGRSVLDFAAGGGIAAIAAAKCGAASVDAAEIDAVAIEAIELNAALNDVEIDIIVSDLLDQPDDGWDVVLAGDVFYERPMAERVLPWLTRLARAGCEVLVADPGRAYLPRTGLTEIARHIVPTSLDLEDRATRETIVYRLEAGASAGGSSSRARSAP